MTITRFRGRHGFLSNFYEADVKFEGVIYPTAEHAFQAAKSEHAEVRERIRQAGSPGHAKKLGRRVALRPDWEEVKYEVMLACLRSKFERHSGLREQLVATGTEKIVEENTWGDREWGVVDGVGENKLGKALMQVREELA